MMMKSVRALRLALLLAATLGQPGQAHAQPATTRLPPRVLERVQRDRWIHEGQHPGFVPFRPQHDAFNVSATVSGGGVPGRSVSLSRFGRGAQLSLTPSNRITSARVDLPPALYREHQDERAAAEDRRRALASRAATTLDLPFARFWEVPFVVPRVPLARSVAWTDTLSFRAENEGLREELSGVWHQEVIGDTVIGGRTLPLVRTRADVRYRSLNLTTDHALDVLFEVAHDASGTLVGVAAVDTAYGVRAAGADTMSLSGTAWLRTGDGRSFPSAVRYERERTWLLRDSTAWEASTDSLRAEREARSTGVIRLPLNPTEERMRAGDEGVFDSVFAVWREATDPDERGAIELLILSNGAPASVLDRMREHRVQVGDSATVISRALGEPGHRAAYTPDLLPYLEDVGRLWRLGIVPRFAYSGLAEQLLRATPILQPDSARWGCAPERCAAFIAQGEASREPRLRDAALVGAFARDPARWYGQVAARADSGSLIARGARALGDGIAATPGAPQVPVPPEGSEWRAWLAWLGGSVRWRGAQGEALRMFVARTGHDPVPELERRRTGAAPDSAEAVFTTILHGMGRLPEPTPQELANILTEGPAAAQATAREQLGRIMRRSGTPAPDTLVTELVGPLLDSLSRGAGTRAPWPASPPLGGDPVLGFSLGSVFGGATDLPVLVLDQDLPAAVRSALPAGFTLITREAWDARPLREGGVLVTVRPMRQWGDFVEFGFGWRVLRRRAPFEAPRGYAGGLDIVLLRMPEGWVVVDQVRWAT